MDDFFKQMHEKGKVRPLSNAFEEYPVEEEEHKGNPDYFLNERKEVYSHYSVGDIVFVNKYTYQDGTEGTKHLFVILSTNWVIPFEYLGLLISSNLDKLKYSSNKFLSTSAENGLTRDSIVKTDVIYKIEDKEILFKIGSINKEQIEEYRKLLTL